MKRWLGWTLGLLTLMAACSDDDSSGSSSSSADLAKLCEATCSKLDECQLLGGLTQEGCVSQCTSSTGSTTNCQNPPTVDSCVSALENAACGDAIGTAQQACACPDGSGGAGQGGNGGTGQGGSGATGSGETCADLQSCCDQIVDANQKQGCESLVTGGNDSLCAQTLSGFIGGGLCSG